MGYNKSMFQGVPKKQINLSRFNRSREWKARIQPGYLIPCLLEETLPNDYYEISSEFMFRFSPMYYPILQKITMRADYFYTPNRILWPGSTPGFDSREGWKEWIANRSTDPAPYFTANMAYQTAIDNNHPLAYMGLPLIEAGAGRDTTIANLNAYPLSGYILIRDEYYRVPQLEDPRWFALIDGDNTAEFDAAMPQIDPGNIYRCYSAYWEKDYFTSALPEPQIGEAVQIPMTNDLDDPTKSPTNWLNAAGDIQTTAQQIKILAGGGTSLQDDVTQIYLDTQTNAAIIKQLRIAEVRQSYFERIMKVGDRYRDFIEGLWGDDPEPAVVDVPVMFGSVFGRVTVSDVMTQANTSLNSQDQLTGDFTGQANLYENGNQVRYKCREHGFIMCILQLNANTSYGQGIERLWRQRTTPQDYALDMFASIGDQEILKEELLYNPVTVLGVLNQTTFGYIPRFSEYRYAKDTFVGDMLFDTGRSMHLGRIIPETVFAEGPYQALEISGNFVQSAAENLAGHRITDVFRELPINTPEPSTVPVDAIIQCWIHHSVWVNRSLPMFSTPDLT